MSIYEYGAAERDIDRILASNGGHSIAEILQMSRGDISSASIKGYALTEAAAAKTLQRILGIYRDVENSFHFLLFANTKRRTIKRLRNNYDGMEELVTTPGMETILAQTAARI